MTTAGFLQRHRAVLGLAVLLPVAVAGALIPLRHALPTSATALVMVVAVVAVAANGRRGAGLLATVGAAAWFDLFLTVPYGHFAITRRDDVEVTVLLFVVGVAVTELAVRGRRHRVVSQVTTSYLSMIATAADAAGSGAPGRVVDHVRADLETLLGARTVRFQRTEFGGLPRLLADGRLRIDDGYWDVDRNGLPEVGLEILAERSSRTLGRFVVVPRVDVHPDRAARQVAKILADQVAVALDQPARTGR